MKKIALLYMGGTFGCVGSPLQPMPEQEFLPKLQQYLDQHERVECFAAPSIKDSSACTANDWLLLAQQIQQLQTQGWQHFIVIHGTDTLSYAAALLARCLSQSCRVILTGSQLPLFQADGEALRPNSDALDNLLYALQHIDNVASGVYLAFYQQLLHGQSSLKVHTTNLQAFSGLDEKIHLNKPSTTPWQITPALIDQAKKFRLLSLMLQPIEPLQLQHSLQGLLNSAPHFLILQGFGSGNMAMNPALLQLIKQLEQAGCMTVLTTQVPFGGIEQRYAINHWLQDHHILLSDCLSHADLYAKCLEMYLQYPSPEQWKAHWSNH